MPDIVIKQENDLPKDKVEDAPKGKKEVILKTGINGFDQLFVDGGLPKGSSVLVAGGPGTNQSAADSGIVMGCLVDIAPADVGGEAAGRVIQPAAHAGVVAAGLVHNAPAYGGTGSDAVVAQGRIAG